MRYFLLLLTTIFTFISGNSFAHRDNYEKIKVYFDSTNCDMDYIREKLDYLNFVRDQHDADVYVMVRTQRIGSGGTEYKFQFTGQGDYSNISNEIRYSISPSATDSEIRDEMVSNISTGMTMFWVHQGKQKIGKIDTTNIAKNSTENDENIEENPL